MLKPDVALLPEAQGLPEITAELGQRLILQPISGVNWGTALVVPPQSAVAVELGLTTEWMDYARVVSADVTGLAPSPLRFVSVHPYFGKFDEAMRSIALRHARPVRRRRDTRTGRHDESRFAAPRLVDSPAREVGAGGEQHGDTGGRPSVLRRADFRRHP